MQDFYLEQAFMAPLTPAREQSLLQRLAACADAHHARWRECLLDDERQRLVCRIARPRPADRAARRRTVRDSDARCDVAVAVPGTDNRSTGRTSGQVWSTYSRVSREVERASAARSSRARAACVRWCLDRAARGSQGP
jgi:hypothetical protein